MKERDFEGADVEVDMEWEEGVLEVRKKAMRAMRVSREKAASKIR